MIIFFTTQPCAGFLRGPGRVHHMTRRKLFRLKGKAVFHAEEHVTGTEKHTLLLEQKGGTGSGKGDRGQSLDHCGHHMEEALVCDDGKPQEGDVRC